MQTETPEPTVAGGAWPTGPDLEWRTVDARFLRRAMRAFSAKKLLFMDPLAAPSASHLQPGDERR